MVSVDFNHDMEISSGRFIVNNVNGSLRKTRVHSICKTLRPYAGIHYDDGLIANKNSDPCLVTLA